MSVIILLFLSFINFLLWFVDIQSITDYTFYLPLISIMVSIYYISPKIKKGRINIRIIYFVIAGILYFNAPLYFKGIIKPNELINDLMFLRIDKFYFIKSCILLGISFPLIILGYLKTNNLKSRKNRDFTLVLQNDKKEYVNVNIYTITAFIFLILSYNVTGLSIGSTFIGPSSYYYVLTTRFIFIISSILVYNKLLLSKSTALVKNISFREILAFIVIILFIIYSLVGGDRGPAFTTILIFIFGYILINKMSLNISHVFWGFIASALLYSLFIFIEVLRLSDAITLNQDVLENTLQSYEEYQPILGSSIRATCLAIEGIDKNTYSHTLGLFFIQSILRSIPFFGNQIVNIFVDENSMFYDGTALLLTIQYSGVNFNAGIGTTYLADLYVEYGLIGIIIVSIIYGGIVGRLEYKCKNLSSLKFGEFLLICIFIGFSFYVGRSSLWVFLPIFIHSWLFYTIVKTVKNVITLSFFKKKQIKY